MTAELVDITDPATKENKIYIRFEGEEYKEKERFVRLTTDEFNALVKLFIDKIVAKTKQKNEKNTVVSTTGD